MIRLGVLLGVLLIACQGTRAEDAAQFPSRQISIVVPFPAGGAADFLARLVGEEFKSKYGQPVVIENRAGASGLTGTEYVSRAAPDGYTLLSAPMFNLSISDLIVRKSKFDPRSMQAVSVLTVYPVVLYARAALPVNSLPELITYARNNRHSLTYASQGLGQIGHLVVEQIKTTAQIEIVHVPYRGSNPAVMDLLSGQVDLLADSVAAGYEHTRNGKFKILAVGSRERLSAFPDIATMHETIPGIVAETWMAVAAPAETPKPITAKISATIKAALAGREATARAGQLHFDLLGTNPEEMMALVDETRKYWAPVISQAKIAIE